MLSQKNRLTGSESIARAFRYGAIFQLNESILVKALYQKDQKSPASPGRVAFSLSKKHLPRAVDRNMLKRRLKRALEGQILEGCDIVFFLVNKPKLLDQEDINVLVARLVQKVYTKKR